MTKFAEMVERTTILRVDIGSRGFGLNTPTSDHDHKAVCIEDFPIHMTAGMKRWEQEGPTQFPVGTLATYPEGLDLETYSLWKFLHLAMGGNPNILCILFHPEPVIQTELGKALQDLAPRLVSKRAGSAFLGYMQAQKGRLISRGRPKFVERFGFDVKFAMHLLRIGFQGIELLKTGKISLPVPTAVREFLIEVREGKHPKEHCLTVATQLEDSLTTLMETSTVLPESPDRDYVELWCRSMYWNEWLKRSPNELLLKPKDLGFGDVVVH